MPGPRTIGADAQRDAGDDPKTIEQLAGRLDNANSKNPIGAPASKRWRRHFLINRRADWLRDVMASDLGAPAKVAAYALSTHLNEKTMSARIGQRSLASDAGMSERRIRDALITLSTEGWLSVKDGGRRENTYTAIDRGQLIGTEPSSQKKAVVRTESSSQTRREVRTETSSQSSGSSGPQPSICEDDFGRFVRMVSTGRERACEDVFGRLSGRNRPHLYNKNNTAAHDEGAEASSIQNYDGPSDPEELDPIGAVMIDAPPPIVADGLERLLADESSRAEPAGWRQYVEHSFAALDGAPEARPVKYVQGEL